jgi:hypothetical protein
MIPRLLHYVWVGGSLPPHQQSFIDTWKATNPDYEIMAWNDDNIDLSEPVLREAYDNHKWAKVADIVRLMAVAQHGGIYFDTDVKIFAPLDPVLVHPCFYAFQQKERSNEWIGNAAFGATPGHPFIRNALDTLLKIKRPLFGMETPTHYGPRHITRLLMEQGLSEYSPNGVQAGDVFIYPTQVFYPYHWKERLTDDKITPETLGVHIWSETPSWVDTMHPVLRLARVSRRSVRSVLNLLS